MLIEDIVADAGAAIKRIDARRPRAANARSGAEYQPGIGPHREAQVVELIVSELQVLAPERYLGNLHTSVPYSVPSRQKCDLCVGKPPKWEWAIEVKMLRLMGDNGKPNDNMLMHILSPYPKDRSALTDCSKLIDSRISDHKGILIYGFDYPSLPMDPAIDAFEALARRTVTLGKRFVATYADLVHPVHRAGRVFGWNVERKAP